MPCSALPSLALLRFASSGHAFLCLALLRIPGAALLFLLCFALLLLPLLCFASPQSPLLCLSWPCFAFPRATLLCLGLLCFSLPCFVLFCSALYSPHRLAFLGPAFFFFFIFLCPSSFSFPWTCFALLCVRGTSFLFLDLLCLGFSRPSLFCFSRPCLALFGFISYS